MRVAVAGFGPQAIFGYLRSITWRVMREVCFNGISNDLRHTSPLCRCYLLWLFPPRIRLLKDGGVWINFGPLLYHWAQSSPGETDERFHRKESNLLCTTDLT